MPDHVGDQIASPQIKTGQDGAEGESDEDVGPAARPMADPENEQWNCGRRVTVEPESLQAFDGIAAIE